MEKTGYVSGCSRNGNFPLFASRSKKQTLSFKLQRLLAILAGAANREK